MSGLDPLEELQQIVLAGLVKSADAIEAKFRFGIALQTCREEFFEVGGWRICWLGVVRYYGITGMPPAQDDFEEILAAAKALSLDQKVDASVKFKSLVEVEASDARFRFACQRLMERWRDDQFATLLSEAQAIHMGQWRDDARKGGFVDAMQHLKSGLGRVEVIRESRSEGSLKRDAQDVWARYAEAKRGGAVGILSGFPELDALTNGLQAGELGLLAAYTSEGKSKTAFNWAYNAAFLQHKNVVFGTSESTRSQVELNLVIRHSCDQRFGLRGGLSYTGVKLGKLSENEERILKTVIEDMRTGDYGNIDVFQLPYRSTISSVSAVLDRLQMLHPIDFVVLDYLGLLAPEQRRQSAREEKDDILVQAKQLATSFNDGKGVALLSPWQVSRQAWTEALKTTKRYTKAALSDSSQAEKSSDLVVALLQLPEEPNTLSCEVLKNRDGSLGRPFKLRVDFSASYVGSDRPVSSILR